MNYHRIKTKSITFIMVLMLLTCIVSNCYSGDGDPTTCNCLNNCPCKNDPNPNNRKCAIRASKGGCGLYGCLCQFACGPNQQGHYSCSQEPRSCSKTSGDHSGCVCAKFCITYGPIMGSYDGCVGISSEIKNCICGAPDCVLEDGSVCSMHCATADVQTNSWKKSVLKPCGTQPLCQPGGENCPTCCNVPSNGKGICNYCKNGVADCVGITKSCGKGSDKCGLTCNGDGPCKACGRQGAMQCGNTSGCYQPPGTTYPSPEYKICNGTAYECGCDSYCKLNSYTGGAHCYCDCIDNVRCGYSPNQCWIPGPLMGTCYYCACYSHSGTGWCGSDITNSCAHRACPKS